MSVMVGTTPVPRAIMSEAHPVNRDATSSAATEEILTSMGRLSRTAATTLQSVLAPSIVTAVSVSPNANVIEAYQNVNAALIDWITDTRDVILEQEFRRLVHRWRTERGPMSSLADMFAPRAYHEIVEMGSRALPLLLRELEHNPDFWFAALREITGEDPVLPEDRGDLIAMANAWLDWGRQRGYFTP